MARGRSATQQTEQQPEAREPGEVLRTLDEIDETLAKANALGDPQSPQARLERVEARCALLTQALAAVLMQQPNRYRTEIILLARGEDEKRRIAEKERDERAREDVRARQAAAGG